VGVVGVPWFGLFREAPADNMSEEVAVALMHEALRVCYYR
jgi:hypothetical protein